MESLSEISINVIFTILGATLGTVLGAGYTIWKEWIESKSDRKYILEHLKYNGDKTEACLKSIEAEFYYYHRMVSQRGMKKGDCSPGLVDVENVSLLRGVYIKSHRHFSASEKSLIEQYLSINSILNQHYLTLNRYIHDGDFLNALFQTQTILVQWLGYVETRDIFNSNVKESKKEFSIDFVDVVAGNLIISSRYNIDYQKISDVANYHYSQKMNDRENKRDKRTWPIVSGYMMLNS